MTVHGATPRLTALACLLGALALLLLVWSTAPTRRPPVEAVPASVSTPTLVVLTPLPLLLAGSPTTRTPTPAKRE